jgi:hypothetical protein
MLQISRKGAQMRKRVCAASTFLLLALIVMPPATCGADMVEFHVIANGGCESATNGTFWVHGTVGQACIRQVDAPDNSSYFVRAGYWWGWGAPHTGPLSVHLLDFTAERDGMAAIVRWRMSSADPTLAFYVWRQEPPNERLRLTDAPLAGLADFEYRDRPPSARPASYWLQQVSQDGQSVWHGPIPLQGLILSLGLSPNWPNPFNPHTSLGYTLPTHGMARLGVFDLKGRLVRTLVEGLMPAGIYTATWDGRDEHGVQLASGVYFARLETPGQMRTQKMVLTK